MIHQLMLVALLLSACSAAPEASDQSQPKDSRSRQDDEAVALELYRADGMVIGLSDYYEARGYQKRGVPRVTHKPKMRYCRQAGCEESYEVSQAFSNAAGDSRTVVAIAIITDWNHAFLVDSYNHRGTTPIAFQPIGNDRSYSIFGGVNQELETGGAEPLAAYVHFAGDQVGADSGVSRRGSVDPTYQAYFYSKNLTCTVSAAADTVCKISFVKDDLQYTFDGPDSLTVLQRLRAFRVPGTTQGDHQVYVAHFVDCGAREPTAPGTSGCWLIGP